MLGITMFISGIDEGEIWIVAVEQGSVIVIKTLHEVGYKSTLPVKVIV